MNSFRSHKEHFRNVPVLHRFEFTKLCLCAFSREEPLFQLHFCLSENREEKVVELDGIEPTASCVQSRRSPK